MVLSLMSRKVNAREEGRQLMKCRWPLSKARAMDVPLGCALSRTGCEAMPTCFKVRSNRSPKASAPSRPTKVTAAPRDAAAQALFAPPPPRVSMTFDTEVSPSRKRYSPGAKGAAFTSRLMFPTTHKEPCLKARSVSMRKFLPYRIQSRHGVSPAHDPYGEGSRQGGKAQAFAKCPGLTYGVGECPV